MNIKLKCMVEVIPFETTFIATDGIVYYTAPADWVDGTVELYPTGLAVCTTTGEILDFNEYHEDGSIDVDKSIENLIEEGISPFELTIKKFRKWTDYRKSNTKLMIFDIEDIEEICPDCQEKLDQQPAKDKSHLPDVVEVVRYVRKKTVINRGRGMEIVTDNMSGMTIVAKLNYVKKEISIQWSDCQNDNFDKVLGHKYAIYGVNELIVPMYTGEIPECGLVDYLYQVASELIETKGCRDKQLNKFYRHLARYLGV